jgi:hypothetical protein
MKINTLHSLHVEWSSTCRPLSVQFQPLPDTNQARKCLCFRPFSSHITFIICLIYLFLRRDQSGEFVCQGREFFGHFLHRNKDQISIHLKISHVISTILKIERLFNNFNGEIFFLQRKTWNPFQDSILYCCCTYKYRNRIHELTISLRYLGIILRVLRLVVSVWIS